MRVSPAVREYTFTSTVSDRWHDATSRPRGSAYCRTDCTRPGDPRCEGESFTTERLFQVFNNSTVVALSGSAVVKLVMGPGNVGLWIKIFKLVK